MKYIAKFFVFLGFLLILATTAVAVYFYTRPESFYTAILSDKLSEAAGRRIEVGGPLGFEVSMNPMLKIGNISIDNPEWASTEKFFRAKKIAARLPVMPLISGEVIVEELELIGPRLFLEAEGDKANWVFKPDAEPGPEEPAGPPCGNTPDIRSLTIRDGMLSYGPDKEDHKQQKLEIDKLEIGSGGLSEDLSIDLEGALNSGNLKIQSKLLRVENKRGDIAAYDAKISIGDTTLDLVTKLTNVGKRCVPRFEVALSGESLAEIGNIARVELPPLGPYEISVKVDPEGDVILLRDLDLQIAESDLKGDLKLTLGEIPKIEGDVSSTLIRISDLTGKTAVAADQPVPEPAAAKDGAGLFSDDPIPLDALNTFHADLKLKLGRVLEGENELLADVDAVFIDDEKHVELDLKRGRLYKGLTSGKLSYVKDPNGLRFSVESKTRDVKLGPLLSTDKLNAEALLSLDLTAVGSSPQQLVNSLDGTAYIASLGGSFDNIILKILTAGLYDLLRPIFGTSGKSNLNCLIQQFEFVEGVATAEVSTLHASDLALLGKGEINLPRGKMDLRFSMKSRNPGLATFLIPFYVKGKLTSPSVLPDMMATGKEIVSAPLSIVKDSVTRVGELSDFVQGKKDKDGLTSFCRKAVDKAKIDVADLKGEGLPSIDEESIGTDEQKAASGEDAEAQPGNESAEPVEKDAPGVSAESEG